MTKEELDAKIAEIQRRSYKEIGLARKQYLEENAKYKVGNIITDGAKTIIIEQIALSSTYTIIYYGVVLTKEGRPRKDGDRRYMYEHLIIDK